MRCIAGSIIDVAVDARPNSKTYGQHVKTLLSAENGCQTWVPEGFLHGFLTREANCVVQYKCTNYYDEESAGRVLWNDPDLNIDWPVEPDKVILSGKDVAAPSFKVFQETPL